MLVCRATHNIQSSIATKNLLFSIYHCSLISGCRLNLELEQICKTIKVKPTFGTFESLIVEAVNVQQCKPIEKHVEMALWIWSPENGVLLMSQSFFWSQHCNLNGILNSFSLFGWKKLHIRNKSRSCLHCHSSRSWLIMYLRAHTCIIPIFLNCLKMQNP